MPLKIGVVSAFVMLMIIAQVIGCESRPERLIGRSGRSGDPESVMPRDPESDAGQPHVAPSSSRNGIESAESGESPHPEGGPECRPGMVKIEGGTYAWNGRKLGTDTFCMDVIEVTVAAYDTCVKNGRCRSAGSEVYRPELDEDGEEAEAEKYSKKWSPACNARHLDRSEHPVNCVDWGQANEYCRAFGKRLPREEEWEWAARGREGRAFPWGSEPPELQLCASIVTRRESTCPVGKFKDGATPDGVLDMAGNVYEWTAQKETIPGDQQRRVARGGSSFESKVMEFATGRRGDRYSGDPRERYPHIGFRCAMDHP